MNFKERFLSVLKARPVVVTICAAALSLAILAGGYFAIRIAMDPYDCRMTEAVTIGGLDVGGMTKAESRNTLKTTLESTLYAQALTVQLPKEDLVLSPKDCKVRVNISKAVNAAYRYGRVGGQETNHIPLLPYLKLDESAIRNLLQEYASRTDTDLSQPKWELTGVLPDLSTEHFDPNAEGQTLLLTMGIPKLQLDVDQIYNEILDAYNSVFSLCASGAFTIVPEVIPEALPDAPNAGAILDAVAIAPVNDSLNMETYEFVHGSYGYGFDPDQVQTLADNAAYGETLRIPLTHTKPEILGDEVYFRDILGHCETKHNTDENRNTNLRLLCQALDGVILQPGEEFSYNGTVGERTKERGFKPATAYSGNRLVKDIGGGVCQGSTTLYNCALLADVEILERVCHGAKVTYIGLGLDAAVNWNTKTDLRFRNNFHFPMMIKAEVADGYVKMQLLGTDEKDYYVEMRCKAAAGEKATYASSYKYKYDKQTGELLSNALEAYSSYYELS